MSKPKRVAIYVRVSTDAQSTKSQRQELEAWAERAGHTVVCVYEDQGISGAKGRDQRPQFDALLKAAIRRDFNMIAVWSSDRLGRSLRHRGRTPRTRQGYRRTQDSQAHRPWNRHSAAPQVCRDPFVIDWDPMTRVTGRAEDLSG